jgi:hypothetical protein
MSLYYLNVSVLAVFSVAYMQMFREIDLTQTSSDSQRDKMISLIEAEKK